MPKKLLSGDAGKILDLSADQVNRLERKGMLPAERTASGVRLFDEADVLRLARARAAKKAKDGR